MAAIFEFVCKPKPVDMKDDKNENKDKKKEEKKKDEDDTKQATYSGTIDVLAQLYANIISFSLLHVLFSHFVQTMAKSN